MIVISPITNVTHVHIIHTIIHLTHHYSLHIPMLYLSTIAHLCRILELTLVVDQYKVGPPGTLADMVYKASTICLVVTLEPQVIAGERGPCTWPIPGHASPGVHPPVLPQKLGFPIADPDTVFDQTLATREESRRTGWLVWLIGLVGVLMSVEWKKKVWLVWLVG